MTSEILFATIRDLTEHTDRLLDFSLPKSRSTHAGHLAAAYDLLNRYSEDHLIEIMPNIIRKYNDATQTPNTDSDGYHHTITLFYIRAIAHFKRELPAPISNLDGCHRLITSSYGQKDFMLRFYSEDCLFSPTARPSWVAPDLASPAFPLF